MSAEFLPSLLLRAWDGYNYFLRVYRYRCDILGNGKFSGKKIQTLVQVFWRVVIQKKKILFLPEPPKPLFVIYKILLFLGYRITNDTSHKVHMGLKWLNAFDGSPFLPDVPLFRKLGQSPSGIPIVNMHCHDVSKRQVSAVFEKIFGYSVSIDPRTYRGKCVMKSNWNGLHVGQILECPTAIPNSEFVYEKLINNETDNGLVQDIRVPIFKSIIPFVYIKQRAIDDRLVDRKHTAKNVKVSEVAEYLSDKEIQKIVQFCEALGLDYGEIDVLRDRKEGKIYIVDVNNNPAGPPEPINADDGKVAITRLAKAFEEAFVF
ncbi:MAG: hypothetical protein R3B74_15355 [Nitrospirales bacterium]|nr:hypothetical protein [Nitrospirales bacterium]